MSKRAPHFVEFNFLTNRNRREQFSQNEKRRADLQKVASSFVFFAPGLSYYLSKFSDEALTSFDYCKATSFRLVPIFVILT